MKPSTIDPITFEVIRNKLQAITEEQALTLKAVSGSPVVTEASDFNNGLYLPDGSIVTMGPQVIFHTGTMSTVIKSILADFKPEDIREGDMFILNDPYKGAIHQPDVSIVAPIFHEGRHVAWAGSCSHQLDMGGMRFGSWGIGATEIQQEAVLIPGVRIVERGVLRDDLWRMIMGMTRLPNLLGLDLKAMIAANNVAARRLKELLTRYGAETVEQVMHDEIDFSERRLRERLKTIPDGVYRARDYLEHDGHTNTLYEVVLSITKQGDSLLFDMEGTSEQAPGFINCTMSGLRGALFTGVLPILAHDIRWNEGVMRPITIKAEEGLLCNAKRPAPTSSGTISAAWVVQNVAVAALSRIVAHAPHLIQEGQAVTKGHMMVMTLAGRGRDGEPFGTFLLDSTAGGGGAYIDHDGLDGSGDYVVPRPTIANVEANEAHGPYLYLYRSFIPDTGGPGEQRGGAGVGLAVTPYDTDGLHAMMLGHGVEVPNAIGLFGGMPGGCGKNLLRRNAGDIAELVHAYTETEALMRDEGVEHIGAKPGNMSLAAGDVLAYTFQGGGGYGDPLLRDPGKVLADVLKGLVSKDAAEMHYGVVITSEEVDAAATAARRETLRRARLGGTAPVKPILKAQGKKPIPPISTHGTSRFSCRCGCDLGPADRNWKDAAHGRAVPAQEAGKHITLHADLELRAFNCPECATLLELEVLRRGSTPLHNVALTPS
ncbi:hydantoinase B/oxoprolinase family protein [Pusillimonas noertemannii]|uniref:N-methylhydantoinase B n=1 Tax=Pusillimonas noertemannii TaxID=305977 RepID=A0A2U1CNP8_9BURK|nr:hydantoinase B/oxoprolinase family protein [Pusillimonas noertemannii]NYT68419.1 hydantoinase B/oxoprolinase family protein [Pusillimonas noertemannii]PVY62564.1 N-methylhydantoinase B [Pusillimonas noertemannii]TFL10487.1 hydantoinase B/oxoprolinase family protein [Pusillimonas noertemannii]